VLVVLGGLANTFSRFCLHGRIAAHSESDAHYDTARIEPGMHARTYQFRWRFGLALVFPKSLTQDGRAWEIGCSLPRDVSHRRAVGRQLATNLAEQVEEVTDLVDKTKELSAQLESFRL
jgi:hypothetical protein